VVTKEAKERILGLIESGVEEGAELVVDGRGFKLQGYENGFLSAAACSTTSPPDMASTRKKSSDRSSPSSACQDYEDALEAADEHEYGNGVAIFTRDGDAARDFASRVNVGMVGINVPIPVRSPTTPSAAGSARPSATQPARQSARKAGTAA
jgi:malonate-semialdehyde dehydrogenase (acetylating)/methylmalonate-semialdehyde dehydrogenase